MRARKKAFGVIYAVPEEFAMRFFNGKNVFVKYLSSQATRIRIGSLLLLYASQGLGKIIGEGVVGQIEFLSPSETVSKYSKQLFLSQQELRKYSERFGMQRNKNLLVLQLHRIRKYSTPLKMPYPITMSERYIDEESYRDLLKS